MSSSPDQQVRFLSLNQPIASTEFLGLRWTTACSADRAGTGKSVLLREIIKSLRKKYVKAPDAVAVTASTGIAACNIGGVTLHSFGGCGLALDPVEVLVNKLKKNKKGAARWLRTKVLIIDEGQYGRITGRTNADRPVSMVDADLFDKLNALGRAIRKQPKPFGGIQIIVTGDFFQLPPVTKGGSQTKFAFDAVTWKETIHQSVNLVKVWRQKDQREWSRRRMGAPLKENRLCRHAQ